MDPALEVADDLFWLRDDTRKDEEILGLLREENAYSQARTSHLDGLRGTLYDEMLSHIKEDDDTYPAPAADGYEYWSRTVKGASFRQHLRRRRGEETSEEIILDINQVPSLPFFTGTANWDAAQCDVAALKPSPSGDVLAYSVDGSGYETYNIRLKDLKTGAELDEQITDTAGQIAWVGDDNLFYVKFDETHRPFQVWRHVLGSSQAADTLVFEDKDELFNVECWASQDGALLFIGSESKETSEYHFVPTGEPGASPTLVRARQYGVRYDVDSHAPSRSIFLTYNGDGKVNRELAVASLDAPSDWKPLTLGGGAGGGGAQQVLPHSQSRSIDSVSAFASFLVVDGREDGFTQLWVVPLETAADSSSSSPALGAAAAADAQRMAFEEDSFTAHLATNKLFDPDGKLRVEYSSMTSPRALLEYDVAGRTYQTLKVQPVPNYDPALYQTKRVDVTARDGVTVPVTLLWRPDATAGDEGGSPCHLYGYGSYGICIDPTFSSTRLALVDRGVVFAIAHVRGGGEMGYHNWYEKMGKYLEKRNTFFDFVDCAKQLLADGVAKPGALTCEGRSAGGLLVGNVVNDAPELFTAGIAGVPFVDLMTTMCDPSIPLTTAEWEEWGNPNEQKYHDYMMSYSPINNVVPGATYPAMLIVSGLNDPRVAYWEPTKWAQVLRARVANGEEVLLKMDLAAGHFSASDRYKYLKELSFDYAWLLDQLGKAEAATPTGGAFEYEPAEAMY